jgi:DNA-binding transcriptional ArsR family regulator
VSNAVNPKREVFENLARIGAALSSPVRLDLLELLAQGERSVEDLALLTGTTIANASQHLQKLKQAGLIVGRKEAQFVRYRLAGDEVVALFNALGAAGQAYLADVDRIVRMYFEAKDDMEPVPAADLLERARKGLVTVLDVRPPEEFAAGHVPGAINIPIHLLRRKGLKARRLQDGLPEWRLAGLPTAHD